MDEALGCATKTSKLLIECPQPNVANSAGRPVMTSAWAPNAQGLIRGQFAGCEGDVQLASFFWHNAVSG